jgi:hypothetical protein
MRYFPKQTDALGAYLATRVHLHGAPSRISELPGPENVYITRWGSFEICDSHLLALCAYIEIDNMWAVQLQSERALGVRNIDGKFVVVEE